MTALNTSWQSFQKICVHPEIEASLYVREETSLVDSDNRDGWFAEEDHWSKRATYFDKGKALFSLQQGAFPEEVIVHVKNSANLRRALQYGLMLAVGEDCVGLHGVTLLCNDEIIILSAPSGTGKTTLAHLLETYRDAITINGDFALLYPSKEGVVFEPTPFCGTSGRSLNHRLRINRIVFLSQSQDNVWQDLPVRNAISRFMSNSFIPDWNENLRHYIQKNIIHCISTLDINAYDFAPTQEAAEIFSSHLRQ